MDQPIGEFIITHLQADSIGSVIIRGVIWVILVTIIAYGVGKGKSMTRIKSEAGFFLLFLILASAAIYVAFGFIPTLTTIENISLVLPLPVATTAYLVHEPSQLHKIASYFPQI
jgi:hypothetical protein